jgi:hypothetical protein
MAVGGVRRPPLIGTHVFPGGQQRLQEVEGPPRVAARKRRAGRQLAGPFVRSQGRVEAAPDRHPKPDRHLAHARGTVVSRAGPGPIEAHLAALARHLGVRAGPDYPRRVRRKSLAFGVGGAVVPGAQERADHRAHAQGAVAELLSRDHRSKLDYADALARRGVGAGGEADHGAVGDCGDVALHLPAS